MKRILGISAFYHDSAAALLIDGEIIAAAQEERFTRVKHTADFPVHAIDYCLREAELTIDDLDAIVFYDKPLLKFERLLQTYYAFAPKGLISFLKAIPIWLNEKMFLKRQIYKGLKLIGDYDRKKLKLLFTEHHLSHAASAFFASPFENAAILTVDGVGEWCTASIGLGEKNGIRFLKEMEFPHSVGLLYSAFTYYLGFKVNSGEYKLMGLAPYGQPNSEETSEYIRIITSELVDVKDDGSIWLNQKYFSYATGLRMAKDKQWEKLFGWPRRRPEAPFEQKHCNLALAVQQVTEDIVLKMATEAKKLTQADYLCMAGGVALNCVANGKLLKQDLFKDIFIQPAAGDAGGALGAALAAHHIFYGEDRETGATDIMKGAYLGPDFSNEEVEAMNAKWNAYSEQHSTEALAEKVAKVISNGKAVGWFQGRMEFGPRALGNRSILGDPTHPDMQKKLNVKIKYRESFRPFAPAVLADSASDYFDISVASPYMLLVADVKSELRKELPADYDGLPMTEKLQTLRSELPAITHVDGSARIQTVHKETNQPFHTLIQAFQRISGKAVLINTSFNVRGEPIVCTPGDAYRCFMATEMDYLVIGNHLYKKTQQLDWQDRERWKRKFDSD